MVRFWIFALVIAVFVFEFAPSVASSSISQLPSAQSKAKWMAVLYPAESLNANKPPHVWHSQVEKGVHFKFFRHGGAAVVKVYDRSIGVEINTRLHFTANEEISFNLDSSIWVSCRLASQKTMTCFHIINGKRQPYPQTFAKRRSLLIRGLKLTESGGERRSLQVAGSASARG